MHWPWRALSYATAALCAVCLAFSFGQPISGDLAFFISLAVMVVWWIASRLFFSSQLFFKQTISVILFALFMFTWANARWSERLSREIPSDWNRVVQMMDVQVVSMPTRTDYGWRMLVQPSHTQLQRLPNMPQQMSLSWADDDLPAGGIDSIRVGQTWHLPVHVRQPNATQNEGVFDQNRYWLANDIEALAYVRVYKKTPPEQLPRLLDVHFNWIAMIENWRFAALRQIDKSASDQNTAEAVGLFKALALGDQSAISGQQWQLFQDTGVTHLVSISGLHVTLLAGILAWLAQKIWRRSAYLTERVPALYVAQWVGLIGALLYALASGWGLPAQRTVWMLALWLFLSRLGVAHSGLRVLVFSVLWVLLIDPFAVLSVGFWLSYGAVAWLVVAFDSELTRDDDLNTQSRSSIIMRWLIGMAGAQLGISLSLLPMTLWFFRQASLLGVLVNFVAIPFISLILLPIFLSVGLLTVFDWSQPMEWMVQLLQWVLNGLQHIAPFAQSNRWVGRIEWWQVLALFILSLLLVMMVRRIWYGSDSRNIRRYGSIAFASTLAMFGLLLIPANYPKVPEGQVRVTIFDVGQGSAVLLQTAHQNWLYDAGPRYSSDADAGARVIVPHLHYMGVRQIDTLVLSHNDQDHTGGALSIVHALPVKRILTSLNAVQLGQLGLANIVHDSCRSGDQYEFDGVMMAVFSPEPEALNDPQVADNQKSCVLRFSIDHADESSLKSILLTGDMDMLTEAKMVVDTQRQNSPNEYPAIRSFHVRSGMPLQSDIIVMPHHGSDSSSSAPLIASVQPNWAVAQAGKYNAFSHPRAIVLERYQAAGAQIWRTDEQHSKVFILGEHH